MMTPLSPYTPAGFYASAYGYSPWASSRYYAAGPQTSFMTQPYATTALDGFHTGHASAYTGYPGLTMQLKPQSPMPTPTAWTAPPTAPYHTSHTEGKKLRDSQQPKQPDFWRDTPMRYLGYSDEMGEGWLDVVKHTLGPKVGKVFHYGSYALAGFYVIADAIDKGFKAYRDPHVPKGPGHRANVITETVGAAYFQFWASFLLPAQTVKLIRELVKTGIRRSATLSKRLPQGSLRFAVIPGILSVAAIPVISHPIDRFSEKLTEKTYWQWVKRHGPQGASKPETHAQ